MDWFDIVSIGVFLGVWFFLTRYVFPKFGVHG